MVVSLEAWEKHGSFVDLGGRRIFYWEQGSGDPLLAIHGFPTSSFDWRKLATLLPERRFIALDLLGFGLSDKPSDGDYSLLAQADLVEGLAKHLGLGSCDLLAHDMGDSVATELLRRNNEGRSSFQIDRCCLLNGSIFIDLAHLTSGQKLFLKMPARKMGFAPPIRLFRHQIRTLFAPDHQPDNDEIHMLEALLAHDGGARMVPITIRYIEERRRMQEIWTKALVEWPGELSLVWGLLDPVAVAEMVDRLLAMRPSVHVLRLADVGHFPQIEAPERVVARLKR